MIHQDQKPIVSAIIIAGVLIAGAVLLRGSKAPAPLAIPVDSGTPAATALAPVGPADRVLGNPQAKVSIVLYEDFQCPFCGKFHTDAEKPLRDAYVQNGSVNLVYRDFAFLGPESDKSAQAARCAGDQGKFWEYHDFLFEHQSGENQGGFADPKLLTFASNLGLNSATFSDCLSSGKYAQAVTDQKAEGGAAGVTGTPKGYVLRDGKISATIDGAEPYTTVKAKIDSALK